MVPLEASYPDVDIDIFIFFLRPLWKIIWMHVHYFPNAPRIRIRTKWAASRKKGPYGIFYQNVYFSIFWIYIILRVVFEKFNGIAFKISFIWGHKHGVYAAASFSANVTTRNSRNDTQFFTSVILYMNIIYIYRAVTVWWQFWHFTLFWCFARRQKLFKQESNFKHTRVNIFYRENMTSFLNYVPDKLRALFAWRGSIVDHVIIKYIYWM